MVNMTIEYNLILINAKRREYATSLLKDQDSFKQLNEMK